MLERTFCHVPGVGEQTERSLWGQGCGTWADYLRGPENFSIGGAERRTFDKFIDRSVKSLEKLDFSFFAQSLGSREAWRAWPEFRQSCVYLDIETDGGQSGTSVTTIGLFDGTEFRCLVKGQDLDEFPELMGRYGMIVTFFGLGFDVPMLKKAFPQVRFDQIHFDLCYGLKRVGYRGGLKSIERQLGIARSEETDGLSGFDAIRLWNEYLHGEDSSLKTLVEYNREDVVNLETLTEIAYSKLFHETIGGAASSAGR